MKTFLGMTVVLALAGCGTDAPSCEVAMMHYYEVSKCSFRDANGSAFTEDNAGIVCQQQAEGESSNCNGDLDDWLNCLNEVSANASNAECAACSAQQMTLIECH